MTRSRNDISPAAAEDTLVRQVLEMARRLAGPYDLTEMLGQIIDAGRSMLQADRGTVFLYDDEARELFLKIGTGIKELRFGIDQGIAGQCARERTIINVPDCYQDPRFNQDIDKQTGYRTKALLAVPLVGLEDQLVGVMQILNPEKGTFDAAAESLAEMFAAQAAVAIQRARLIDERIVKLKLERDLQLARKIQMGVLPNELPEVAGYELASFSQPADQTGGDIYDLVSVPGPDSIDPRDRSGLVILLADATGHGVGPAISVTQVRAMLRLGLKLCADIDSLLMHINNQLTDDLAAERFVTAFLGVLDSHNHQIIYHSPGQGPLLHYHAADNRLEWLKASTFPLGILTNAPMERPEPIQLAPGDAFILLTDGFYEYMDKAGKQFGQDRVGEVILQQKDQSPQAMVDTLLADIKRFAPGAEQGDDLTAVIVKRTS